MPDGYLTHDEALKVLLRHHVKRRTATSALEKMRSEPDPDRPGEQMWAVEDVEETAIRMRAALGR